ncbi:MAG: NUDIX domain-containing protein [Candidatus Sulfotelmatobacter sp.]
MAAVCYRERGAGLEFLLVRTRGSGRWTFPKGNAEPGMTHAQAAALEAFEEAGVHGRIEEASFASYVARKRALNSAAQAVEKLAVNAHLCDVLRLGSPKESNRKRTWFSAEDARQQLRRGRKGEDGDELARVIDRAVERIKRLQKSRIAGMQPQRNVPENDALPKDALHKVQFEIPSQSRSPYFGCTAGELRRSPLPSVEVQPRKLLECEILQFASGRESNRSSEWFAGKKKPKALGTGARD